MTRVRSVDELLAGLGSAKSEDTVAVVGISPASPSLTVTLGVAPAPGWTPRGMVQVTTPAACEQALDADTNR